MRDYSLSDYQSAAEAVAGRFGRAAKTALVLGSGLGGFADTLAVKDRISFADIPFFPHATNQNHKGEIVSAGAAGRDVLVLSGRAHGYEGYTMRQTAFYVRVLRLLGVDTLVLTNAAGAVNEAFAPGELMLITDHIKLCAESPVSGAPIPEFGERFFDMTRAYDPALGALALESARRLGVTLRSGVYMYFAGPQYETPAEVRAARALGADAVGMSTVPEVIAAAGCGMRVLGVSLLTNMAAGVTGRPLCDREVVETAEKAGARFSLLMNEILKAL